MERLRTWGGRPGATDRQAQFWASCNHRAISGDSAGGPIPRGSRPSHPHPQLRVLLTVLDYRGNEGTEH